MKHLQHTFRSTLTRCVLALGLVTGVAHAAQAQNSYFADRPDVANFIADMNTRYGFSIEELKTVFALAEPQPKVIELIQPPTQPGVRSWKRYRSRFIDPVRISKGVEFWQAHEKALRAAEANYGVPAEIIAGIIGVETIYGRNTGNFSILSALATLAFDYPPRAALFRSELESLFLLAREQGKTVMDYRGSYAGAIGLPQFLPSSIRKFAADGDADGIIDLQNDAEDAIASVGNFLMQHGWQRGGRIVEAARVSLDANPQALVDAGILPSLNARDLEQAGVFSAKRPADDELVTLVDLITPGEPTQYWLGFHNFYVITRYNHSAFYAMAVHDLAQALKTEVEARKSMVSLVRNEPQSRQVQSTNQRGAKGDKANARLTRSKTQSRPRSKI